MNHLLKQAAVQVARKSDANGREGGTNGDFMAMYGIDADEAMDLLNRLLVWSAEAHGADHPDGYGEALVSVIADAFCAGCALGYEFRELGMQPAKPVDGNHALLVGNVAGALAEVDEFLKGQNVTIIDDEDGDHLDTIEIVRPSGRYQVTVKKVADD